MINLVISIAAVWAGSRRMALREVLGCAAAVSFWFQFTVLANNPDFSVAQGTAPWTVMGVLILNVSIGVIAGAFGYFVGHHGPKFRSGRRPDLGLRPAAR